MGYILVEDRKALEKVLAKASSSPYLSIDIESNGLYAYRESLCVVQLSAQSVDAVIDSLKVDVSPLKPLLEDPAIEKLFHSGEWDIKMLKTTFHTDVRNIFDVMIASKYLGFKRCGLDALVKEHFNVDLNKKFQKADWGRRPITQEMLDYAIKDVKYLYRLRKIFARQLAAKGRLEEIKDEFEKLERLSPLDPHYDPDAFFSSRQSRGLSPRQLAVLKELFAERDRRARDLDRPAFKVVGDDFLGSLARDPEQAMKDMTVFKGATEYVLSHHGHWLEDAVARGLAAPEYKPPRRERRERPEAGCNFEGSKKRAAALKNWRNAAAGARGMLPESILNNDMLERIAQTDPQTLEALAKVKGLTKRKIDSYGAEMLAALEEHRRACQQQSPSK